MIASNRPMMGAALLSVVFIAINVMFIAAGVRLGGDSSGYLDGAHDLLQRQAISARQATFVGYISLVAICQFSGAGLAGVIAVQFALAAIAAIALYDLGRQLKGHETGALAACLFIANPDIARWNAYILTDGVYASLVVLATWSALKATRSDTHWFGMIGVTCFAASIRPHGWLLPPVISLFWLCTLSPERHRRRTQVGVAIAVPVLLVASLPICRGIHANLQHAVSANASVSQNLLNMTTRGMVIWGYDGWRLEMPEATEQSSAVSYVATHPIAVLRLVAARIGAELIHARPFYSTRHNAFVVAYLLPLYGFACLAAVRLREQPRCRLIMATIAAHMAFVGLTWADWDGRFLNYVLPLISLLGACGVVHATRTLMPQFFSDRQNLACPS